MSGYTELRNAINYAKESKLMGKLLGYNKNLGSIDSVLNLLSHNTTNDCDEDKVSVLNILNSIKGAKNYTNKFDKYKNVFNERKINILYEGDSWLDYGPPLPTDLLNVDLKNRIIDYYNKNYGKHVSHLDIAKFGDVTGFMTMNNYKDDGELHQLNNFYFKHEEDYIKRKKLENSYKPYLKTVIDEFAIDVIVFSGGGNDILAEYLSETLREDVVDDISQDDIKIIQGSDEFYDYYIKNIKPNEKKVEYDDIGKFCIAHQDKFDLDKIFERCVIKSEFDKKMNFVKERYFYLIKFVKSSKNPRTSIIGHTYDYAVLRENDALGIGANRPNKTRYSDSLFAGPWIKPYFDKKKIHSRTLRALVLIYMINRFKVLMQEIKEHALNQQVDFDFVDFHKTFFESNYMTDEIHPSTIGSKYLFNQFNKKMLPAFLNAAMKKKIDVFKKIN